MQGTIIIAEKPDAASHIAQALSEGKARRLTSEHGVDYFAFERGGKTHYVIAAVGHLFNLKQSKGKGWTYPVFDVEWAPSFKIRKASLFSEKYFRTIEELKGRGNEFIIACDYDNEGTVIGYNVLKFIFEKNDAKRMKFSTLTKQDLIKSYEEMSPHIDTDNLECGLARHIVDFYYGINSSRALTLAIKKGSNRFALLSAGRVQGPVLALLAEREKEIKAFKPVPFWQLLAKVVLDGKEVEAPHEMDKFWKKDEADTAFKNSKGAAVVEEITKKEYTQSPPVPMNITSLQTEAYRLFGYSPQQTMAIAQDLYTKAFISYPRTSSEKFPPQIGYADILKALSKIKKYGPLCAKLLGLKELKPSEGKRDDPAHEAIHPTVEPPDDIMKLKGPQRNIYDLVCRRFLAVFGEPAIREGHKITLKIGKEKYSVSGRRTVKSGWIDFYGPLAKFDEVTLPEFKKGDKIKVNNVEELGKETQPPARWSQAAMIKEMEKRGLGTRATRASILQTLYDRAYVMDKSVRVTDLGMAVADTLKKYVPDFVDEQLTKNLEHELVKIQQGKMKKEVVIEDAKKALIKISEEFKKNEEKIGKELGKAVIMTQEDKATVGPCPKCGGTLKVLYSPWTKKSFVGCSSYSRCANCGFTKTACKCKCPICGGVKGKCACEWKQKIWTPKCQTGYPLPHNAMIQRLDKVCDKCNTPMIQVIRKGKRPFRMCLDPKCETKADWGKPRVKAKKAGAKLKELKESREKANAAEGKAPAKPTEKKTKPAKKKGGK